MFCLSSTINECSDVIYFKKCYGRLRLAVQVKDLSHIWLSVRCVCVASAEATVIRHNYHLEHVIVKRQRHLIEGADVLIECGDCKNVGMITEICCQTDVSSIVANGSCQPERLVGAGPLIADQPLAGSKPLNDRSMRVEPLFFVC